MLDYRTDPDDPANTRPYPAGTRLWHYDQQWARDVPGGTAIVRRHETTPHGPLYEVRTAIHGTHPPHPETNPFGRISRWEHTGVCPVYALRPDDVDLLVLDVHPYATPYSRAERETAASYLINRHPGTRNFTDSWQTSRRRWLEYAAVHSETGLYRLYGEQRRREEEENRREAALSTGPGR